jgi:hypothetical protein
MKRQTVATKTVAPKAVVPKVPVEVKSQSIEVMAKDTNLADTLFLLTDRGLKILHGYSEDSRKIIGQISGGNDSPYTFYQDGKVPVYFATKYSDMKALAFPDPKDYGITSSNLFALADTYAKVIGKFIKLKIMGKPSLLSQIRQIGVVAGPMIVIALVILVIIAMLGG